MWKYDLVAPNLQTKATTPNPNPVTNAKRETGYKRETRNAKPVATAKPERETQDALLQRVMWKYDLVAPKPGDASKLMAQVHYSIDKITVYFTTSWLALFTRQNPVSHHLLHTILCPKSCIRNPTRDSHRPENRHPRSKPRYPTSDTPDPRPQNLNPEHLLITRPA